jgi:hypothetical protein
MQPQQQTEWCWAAITASVSAFFKDSPARTQCDIATECLNVTCCVTPLPPPPPPYWDGNRTYTLDAALTAVGHLGGNPVPGQLDFPAITAQIDAGRPVCCHITWDAGGPPGDDGHFTAIVGYDAPNRDVIVRDPYPVFGNGTFPFDAFRTSYYGGTWDYTYLTS